MTTIANAWSNDDGQFTLALKCEGDEYWTWYVLTEATAVQIADQLRLLTRTTD